MARGGGSPKQRGWGRPRLAGPHQLIIPTPAARPSGTMAWNVLPSGRAMYSVHRMGRPQT